MTAVIGPVGLSREPSDYEGGAKYLCTWSKKTALCRVGGLRALNVNFVLS